MKLWSIPTLYTSASLVAAIAIPRLESAYAPQWTHAMSVTAATAFLTATASGILAFTAIVFSIAFVMVQFSAMAYSPRLVLWFANRPALYHALGIFIATFTYAMATLLWTDRGGSGTVPLISTMIVLALLVASMGSFVLLVRSIGSLQITEVLSLVGRQGRKVIADQESGRSRATHATTPRVSGRPHDLGEPHSVIRHTGEPRCVTRVDVLDLIDAAREADAVLVLVAAVGDTMVEGSPLIALHGMPPGPDPIRLVAAVRLGAERTFDQDPKYALRLLVDIAIKALSPAINDPTTAVQALDQIDDLLRRLSRLDLGSVWLTDEQGQTRLFVPLPDWGDYLSLAFDEIRQFGLTSLQVVRRLRAALEGLLDIVDRPERLPAVRAYLVHIDQLIANSNLDVPDRVTASRVDLQGLGFSRDTGVLQHPDTVAGPVAGRPC